MQKFFCKAFGIYPSESKQALCFARLSFLWSFGGSCLDTLSDGLFLEKVGALHLPIVYLSTACAMISISTLILYCLRFTSPYRILLFALALGAAICASSAMAFLTHPTLEYWYLLKIASRMFFAVMIAISWTFTDQYHDLQDAKRVYSLYTASYFLGSMLAGFSIQFFLDALGFSFLLLLSSAFLLLAMYQGYQIAHTGLAVEDDTVEGVFSSTKSSLSSIIQLILRSRFTLWLLSLSLVLQLLLTVTEFNYMESFSSYFQTQHTEPSEGKIAEFLGTCRALISLCNIGVGVFFYGRFVRRLGVNNLILLTPLFFLSVYCLWIFQHGLALAILGLVAVDGILFTIEDNSFNLLSNAVPTKLKSKVRIINDSFFESFGMFVSSFLLFGLQSGGRWLGWCLSLLALFLALLVRQAYPKAILTNLKENAFHFERKFKGWILQMNRREQKETQKGILQALKAPEEEEKLIAMESILQSGNPQSISHLLQVARSLSDSMKVRLLKILDTSEFSHDSRVIKEIEKWITLQESPSLCRWAHYYLAKRGFYQPEMMEDALEDPDILLRGAAILTFKKSCHASSTEEALHHTIANKKLDLMLKSDEAEAICIALDILAEEGTEAALEKALDSLSDETLAIRRAAARCINRLSTKEMSRHAPRLIQELQAEQDNAFRLLLIEALGKMADSSVTREMLLASTHFRPNERRCTEQAIVQMGLKVVPWLLAFTKDAALPERARILAGKSLARLSLPQLQTNLIEILDLEIERAYFYFYFGHTIQEQYPLYDLELLKTALLTGYQSVIDFIIHLLGAAGSLEDPELLVRSLHSRNAKTHSQAVESLEKTCDTRIFRLIVPLVDDLPLEEKMAACLRWQGHFPKLTLAELLGKLEVSPSLFDKIVSVRLKSQLQVPHWRYQLRELMKKSDETFHKIAYELLES